LASVGFGVELILFDGVAAAAVQMILVSQSLGAGFGKQGRISRDLLPLRFLTLRAQRDALVVYRVKGLCFRESRCIFLTGRRFRLIALGAASSDFGRGQLVHLLPCLVILRIFAR
jgi:hypothetical protein